MAHRVTTRYDQETGRTTRSITIDGRQTLTGEALAIAQAHFANTLKPMLPILEGIEDDLRTGAWRPEHADVILGEIERLRVLWTVPSRPVVEIGFVGIRLGMLLAEADAKTRWPSLIKYREFRLKQSARSRAGIVTKADAAARPRERLRKVAQACRAQYPDLSVRKMARKLQPQFPNMKIETLRKAIALELRRK